MSSRLLKGVYARRGGYGRASTRLWLRLRARCITSGTRTILGRARKSYSLFKQPISFPRRVFCARVLLCHFASPRSKGRGAPRDERVLEPPRASTRRGQPPPHHA